MPTASGFCANSTPTVFVQSLSWAGTKKRLRETLVWGRVSLLSSLSSLSSLSPLLPPFSPGPVSSTLLSDKRVCVSLSSQKHKGKSSARFQFGSFATHSAGSVDGVDAVYVPLPSIASLSVTSEATSFASSSSNSSSSLASSQCFSVPSASSAVSSTFFPSSSSPFSSRSVSKGENMKKGRGKENRGRGQQHNSSFVRACDER